MEQYYSPLLSILRIGWYLPYRPLNRKNIGLFGWGEFGLMDLDLRAQIQVLYLDDLKPLGFGFRLNPSKILKAQIHGFQMTS